MSTYTILVIVCGIIIYSYLADMVARRTKVPSVLILLCSGMALRWLVEYLAIRTINFNLVLPALGTIGLIMIVFEGALELEYEPSKKQLISKAFGAALLILVGSALAIAGVIYYLTGKDLNICLLNAVPFSVISSAIAIPSVGGLPLAKREFVVYESSFSDILGIMFFNFMDSNEHIQVGSFLKLGVASALTLLIAGVVCLFLLYVLGRIGQRVKYVFVIALLILVYAISRMWHLPALVIVFAFGLFLKNVYLIPDLRFRRLFLYDNYETDLHQLHQISAESAFLLRTFFFIIFGFTINVGNLVISEVIQFGSVAFIITLVVRYLGLRATIGTVTTPEWYITPRGLISILLFYSIADSLTFSLYQSSMLLFLVLATNLLMSIGLVRYRAPLDTN